MGDSMMQNHTRCQFPTSCTYLVAQCKRGCSFPSLPISAAKEEARLLFDLGIELKRIKVVADMLLLSKEHDIVFTSCGIGQSTHAKKEDHSYKKSVLFSPGVTFRMWAIAGAYGVGKRPYATMIAETCNNEHEHLSVKLPHLGV